jgi:predicted DNA-binding protein
VGQKKKDKVIIIKARKAPLTTTHVRMSGEVRQALSQLVREFNQKESTIIRLAVEYALESEPFIKMLRAIK